jgi:phosphoribosylanthranilate isomerase
MTKIKICGLKRIEDVQYVNKYLPDYIGFVFAESKRKVTMEQAAELREGLDSRIKAVGVFVNESLDKVVEIAEKCRLDAIQLHGDEDGLYVEKLKGSIKSVEIWKAIRVKDESSLLLLNEYKVDAFVLDAFVEGAYGGVGKVFDWKLAKLAKEYGRIIVAGGLSVDNVSGAVELVMPYGVDVSSNVETDGVKDELKIQGFIEKVRKVL